MRTFYDVNFYFALIHVSQDPGLFFTRAFYDVNFYFALIHVDEDQILSHRQSESDNSTLITRYT